MVKEKRKEFCPAKHSKLVSITTEQAQSNLTAKEEANFKVSQNVIQSRESNVSESRAKHSQNTVSAKSLQVYNKFKIQRESKF